VQALKVEVRVRVCASTSPLFASWQGACHIYFRDYDLTELCKVPETAVISCWPDGQDLLNSNLCKAGFARSLVSLPLEALIS
jgi:hypothetical protein